VQAELLKVKEIINKSDCSRMYLVQCVVDGKKTVPFWSFERHRRELGDEKWVVSLLENAAHIMQQCGPCKDTLI
jgi:hypothetical protein